MHQALYGYYQGGTAVIIVPASFDAGIFLCSFMQAVRSTAVCIGCKERGAPVIRCADTILVLLAMLIIYCKDITAYAERKM